jgi:Ion channel
MPRSLRRPLAELRYIENLRATSPRRDGKRPEYAVPGEAPMPRRSEIRHSFYRHFVQQIRIVWPVISALLVLIAGMGVLVATLEGWSLLDGVYFSFVTGFTIGYGDLAPQGAVARVIAIVIGLHGILLTALLAAITVRALQATGETLKT